MDEQQRRAVAANDGVMANGASVDVVARNVSLKPAGRFGAPGTAPGP
jgi:hypothetical protein